MIILIFNHDPERILPVAMIEDPLYAYVKNFSLVVGVRDPNDATTILETPYDLSEHDFQILRGDR